MLPHTHTHLQQSTSLFGSTAQPQQSTSIFGNAPQQQQSTSLFGSVPQQQQPASLFGGAPQQQQSTAFFGAAPQQQSTSFFGGAPQQQPTSLFGSTAQAAAPTSLFGSSANAFASPQASSSGAFYPAGNTNMLASGGGGFASPSLAGNVRGSLFSPSGAQSLMPSTSQILIPMQPQYASYGLPAAVEILQYSDAPDLQYGKLPSRFTSGGTELQQQQQLQQPNNEAQKSLEDHLKNGLIPERLRVELENQQMEIDEKDRLLDEIFKSSIDLDISKVTEKTKSTQIAAQRLRNDLDQQKRSVNGLVSGVKTTCKDAERGVRETRLLESKSNVKFTMDKPIPSDFFWTLVQQVEERVTDYDSRAEELNRVLSSISNRKLGTKLRMDEIAEILNQQYKALKIVADSAACAHAEVDALRNRYNEWHLKVHGELPKDFDNEERMEKDRERRMLKKIDKALMNVAVGNAVAAGGVAMGGFAAIGGGVQPQSSIGGSTLMQGNMPFASPGQQPQQQQQQQQGGGGMFGGAPATGGLFANPSGQPITPFAPQTPGFGGAANTSSFFSPQPSAGGGSLFGGATPATPIQFTNPPELSSQSSYGGNGRMKKKR